MLKLIPRSRRRIPHGVAVVGALLLLASTVTGVGRNLQDSPSQPIAVAATVASENGPATAETVDAAKPPAVKKNKRFRVNLFLFRH